MSNEYEFYVPVTWEVSSSYNIKASSYDEACEKAKDMDLPDDGQYIDGSFEISYDFGEDANEDVFELKKVDETSSEDLPLLIGTLKHDKAKKRLEERLQSGKDQ